MWNRQPPTPAPCLHLSRKMVHLPRLAAASQNIRCLTLFLYLYGPFLVFVFFFFVLLSTPHPVFICVCLSFLYCSVTRSRSSLSLVYVLPCFSFSFACRLSGLVLAHPFCVGSSAPQRAFALLLYCSSFSADHSNGYKEGVHAPMD